MSRSAFTFVEVMACVLILTLSLLAAVGLILFGLHLARSAHGKSIGMATAMTALADPSPLRTDPSQTPSGANTQGYLNGLWVVRSESNPVLLPDPSGKMAVVTVVVDVYDGADGTCVASVNRRMVRRLP